MNEKHTQSVGGEIVSIDTALVFQIKKRKDEGDYMGILKSLPDFRDTLLSEGFSSEELLQIPAWHVLIGSTIPFTFKRTISNARQEEIESRIRDFMEPHFKHIEAPIGADEEASSKAA